MKKTAFILLLVLIASCNSKEKDLIGKWQKTEEHYGGNLGEKLTIEKVNNKTYTFLKDNKLELIADGLSYNGVYEVVHVGNDDILHTITSSQKQPRVFDSYFRIQLSGQELMLIPVHPDNEVMSSSGRADKYKKIE